MSEQAQGTYRFADNARGSVSNNFGNYIIKRGMGEIRKPTWNRTETVIRILPSWNFKANSWEPFRYSSRPCDFGDWLRRYDVVRRFGSSGVTMLLYDPMAHQNYDIQTNPCVILYKAINSAVNSRQDQAGWAGLLRGQPGSPAELSRHSPAYIVRCGIFKINNKNMAMDGRSPLGLAPTDSPYFFEMPRTAGEKLLSMLEEPAENYSGDPEDFDAAYKYGDIVSIGCGAYVHFFEEGADPRQEAESLQVAPRTLTIGSGANFGRTDSGGRQFRSYDIFIDKVFRGLSPRLDTEELERIVRMKQRPWEDCLQFFDHQQQAFLVQDGFPPSAILYAWRDHPEWIKDETRSKAVDRVSATAMPIQSMPPSAQPASGAPSQARQAAAALPTPRAQAETGTVDSRGGVIGGWGAAPWDGDQQSQDESPGPDIAVPKLSVISDEPEVAGPVSGAPTVPGMRELRVRQALEAARSRNVGRTPAGAQ